MRAIYAHGLATIIQLSITSEDARERFRAAAWLCQEAEKRLKLEVDRPPDQREETRRAEIISEIRDLYRKALPAQESLVEVVSDATAAEEAVGEEGSEPSGESLTTEEEVSWNPTAPEGGEESRAATAPAPARYVMERITPPGYFPPRFRKVCTP